MNEGWQINTRPIKVIGTVTEVELGIGSFNKSLAPITVVNGVVNSIAVASPNYYTSSMYICALYNTHRLVSAPGHTTKDKY